MESLSKDVITVWNLPRQPGTIEPDIWESGETVIARRNAGRTLLLKPETRTMPA